VHDQCAQARPLTAGVAATGTVTYATGSVVGDLCTDSERDVYYSFTAPVAGGYAATLTPTGDIPHSLAIGDACGAAFSGNRFCADAPLDPDPITSSPMTLTAGQTILLRVADYFETGASTFSLVVNSLDPGACCTGTNCTAVAQAACPAGSTFTIGGTCGPTACTAPSTVICCRGSTCAVVAQSACTLSGTTQAGAASAGAGAACNGAGNNNAPCCKADYNKISGVDLIDIFAFLEDWFNTVPYTDFDGQNGVDLIDIFAFLEAWFAGCT
jgi:hypothetical protein